MRGRKPDDAGLQAAKGNPGRRPSKAAAAVINPGEIKPPRWLTKSRKAMDVWREYVPLLARLNFVNALDAQPLGRYCRYVVEWIVADEAIRKEGTWYDATDTNGNSTKRQHPAFKAMQTLEKALTELEASYGMRADTRFKILRDQSAALGGYGGLPLFGDQVPHAPPSSVPDAPAPAAEADPIGALARLDAVPPGSRPN
ncbi:phage terminase small subunit P27 family [Ancylobacter sp. FA202]|uniref:phage terminase small subunit P27 family n=1 Tax=Ancylobacter sp. FA202 TaxID=1111106 RepID=UPI00036CB1BD|nr:phage terminase small subunit P27 family [Ancylobacter sp. FA202]